MSASSARSQVGIKRTQVIEVAGDGHAAGHLLVLGDVADLRQFLGRYLAQIHAQDGRAPCDGEMMFISNLMVVDLAGAVGADQGEGAALGHCDAEPLEAPRSAHTFSTRRRFE